MAVAGKKKIFDNKYEIISIVGRGSRSVVYHARNVADDNGEVALKVLIENKKDTISNSEKLRREALAMVSSHHPSVVRLDDFHSVGDICYLSMEYAHEADLRKYASKTGGKISIEQAENYLIQVCEALEYIHRVGIIHRDIKPDNLLVVDANQIRVGDFGVALLPGDENAPQDLRNAVGTMDYMAPEVLEGIDYNQRSDIYSLAVSFYEMISGTHPFAAATLAQQLDVRRDEVIPTLISLDASVPQYLSEAIKRGMSYDPKDRFTSAKELLQHLKQKRTQKQPTPAAYGAPAPKRDDRPQLKVIAGSAGAPSQSSAPAQTIEPTTTTPTNSSEQEPQAPSDQGVTEISEQTSPEPIPSEPTISEETKVTQDTMQPAENLPLKDSRASRTPTVFISKESAEKIREETTTARPKVATRSISAHKAPPKQLPSSNSMAVGMAAIGILLTILGWNVLSSHRSQSAQVAKLQETEETSVLPSYEGDDLSFPNLPAGTYIGAIQGLLPKSLVPMTIVSMGDSKQLALIIGLDGWNPTVVTLGDTAPSAVRVVSNGFILEFSGQVSGDHVQGTVKNIIAGTQGAFALKPF